MNRSLKKSFLAAVLAGVMSFHPGLLNWAFAMHIPAPESVQPAVAGVNAAHDRETVQRFLEQKVVRDRLAQLGLSDAQASQRLALLSDEQMHQVALHIDKEAPAGDGSGAVISVLVIGILVLLFVYLLKRV
jgi:hypothetical protein